MKTKKIFIPLLCCLSFFLYNPTTIAQNNTLQKGQQMTDGDQLVSSNGTFEMSIDSGNVIVRNVETGAEFWSLEKFGNGVGCQLRLQSEDGNFCLYNKDNAFIWCSMQFGNQVVLQDNGTLVQFNESGEEIWASSPITNQNEKLTAELTAKEKAKAEAAAAKQKAKEEKMAAKFAAKEKAKAEAAAAKQKAKEEKMAAEFAAKEKAKADAAAAKQKAKEDKLANLYNVGNKNQGGIIFKIFGIADNGYVEGEVHGLVCEDVDNYDDATQEGAVNHCAGLDQNGFNDWRLPSDLEMNLMWENLHRFGCGTDKVHETCSTTKGDFTTGYYWTSSKDINAWPIRQIFSNGEPTIDTRNLKNNVRAIRAF